MVMKVCILSQNRSHGSMLGNGATFDCCATVLFIRLGNLQSAEAEEITSIRDETFLPLKMCSEEQNQLSWIMTSVGYFFCLYDFGIIQILPSQLKKKLIF